MLSINTTRNGKSSTRCTNKKSKQKLLIISAALSAVGRASGFGTFHVIPEGSHPPLHSPLRYKVSDDNAVDNGQLIERQGVNGSQNSIGVWFNGILKPKPEKDDFEKYVDFLGHRYSRLKNFDGAPTNKALTELGLDDVHNQYKAKQGIMAFNFKEASTALDRSTVSTHAGTGKKVSQVIYNAQSQNLTSAVSTVADFGGRLAVVSSLMLKKLQVIRKRSKSVTEQVGSAVTKVVALLLRPTTGSLALACALIMYKPLKGVALAIAAVSQEA